MELPLEFIILGASSFIIVSVSLIISILSMRKFLKSKFKSYLRNINITYLLIVLPYTLWMFDEISGLNNTGLSYFFKLTIYILMITSGLFFIKTAFLLKDLANAFGFKRK